MKNYYVFVMTDKGNNVSYKGFTNNLLSRVEAPKQGKSKFLKTDKRLVELKRFYYLNNMT